MNCSDFGKLIQTYRVSRGYTLRALAEMIDISPYYLSLIENGKKINPNIKIIGKIYLSLNLSKEEMEQLLYLHAKSNNYVCSDIADFIMSNEDVIKAIRSERDKPDSFPNWNDFIDKICENK